MSRTLKTISMTLDPKSVLKAAKEVEDCITLVRNAINRLIQTLTERGAEIAKMQVASFDAVDSGELYGSIYGYFDEASRIGYVIAGAPHAFYVEYGTGTVGAGSPHPEAAEAGWQYAVGESIFITKDGRTGWFYNENSDGVFSAEGGGWHFTMGQPARPFMYNTFIWLQEAAEALGREITLE